MAREFPHLSRRQLLQVAAGAAVSSLLPSSLRGATHVKPSADDAIRAARWIRMSRITTPNGVAWPADPLDPDSVQYNLYSGAPGVALFLLELHHATGDGAALEEAVLGARELAASLPAAGAEGEAGLYTGVAGIAFVLMETARATGDRVHREAATRAVEWLLRSAQPVDGGVRWNDSTDIISGSAGIALLLLRAEGELNVSGAADTALRASRHLATLGIPDENGVKWRMSDTVTNLYPNFSHGTAGVAYTLATLGEYANDAALLDAAVAGATYLDAVADRSDGCKVFHHEPGGEQLFYLSWCHGPAGTARLHRRLHLATGDARWNERIDCGAHATLAMGAPERRTEGYWNNISQCCGSAGVGEFFLALHGESGDAAHLAVAERAARDVLTRATDEGGGLKWIQAEHRVRPELLVAQTGLMQGAAGVGLFLLRLDAARSGRRPFVHMPDTPFS